MIKKFGAKEYKTKEFSFLCLPILNYCIVLVSVRYDNLIKSESTRATPPLDFYLFSLFSDLPHLTYFLHIRLCQNNTL
jgi:hypothetical protein